MVPSIDVSLLRHNNASSFADTLRSKSTTTTQIHEITNDDSILPNTLVLNPALVTQDFDALRFQAAAANQLPSPDSPTPASNDSPTYSTLLISSPYNNPGHYLDLTTLPTPSRLLALALTNLAPTRPDYALAPYTASLNLPTVIAWLRAAVHRSGIPWRETSFYVVVFRSKLHAGVDQEWLYKLDYESHREACESGGLLKYWFGKADLSDGGERRNLATCFWHSRADAQKGGLGPWHAKARAAGRTLYESIVFSTHRFTVLDGVEGWRFEDWED